MKGQEFLLLPLLWAVLYAIGSLVLKRAFANGGGALRIAFLNNVTLGLFFLPGVFWLRTEAPASAYGWVILTSVIYFVAQLFIFLAMRIGDISVVAPTMGLKVVVVAGCTVLLGAGPVPWTWWGGSVLATSAVFLLGFSNWADRRRAWQTGWLTALAATLYSVSDVLTQQHAPALGAAGFTGLMYGLVGLQSLLLIPFFREPLRAFPTKAWPWALAGAVVLSVQSGGSAMTIAYFGHATSVNIVYSTRGLWSVLLVWLVGHWFGNYERTAGRGVMARRLVGALLLLGAVGLVFAK